MLKGNNRAKAQKNQELRDRNVELTESRDHWRAHTKEQSIEFKRQKEELERQLKDSKEEALFQRRRADEEQKRADLLQTEIETVWKKKS